MEKCGGQTDKSDGAVGKLPRLKGKAAALLLPLESEYFVIPLCFEFQKEILKERGDQSNRFNYPLITGFMNNFQLSEERRDV